MMVLMVLAEVVAQELLDSPRKPEILAAMVVPV